MASNLTLQTPPESIQQGLVDSTSQGSNESNIPRNSGTQSHFRGSGLQLSGSGLLNIGRDLNIVAPDSPLLPQVFRVIHFPRNDDFVQRSVITERLNKLLPPRSEYQSAALWGLGGSGKTQLALEYAYGRCSDPSCSVFWVHADSETSFTQDYKWIATKLGIGGDLEGEKLLTAVRAYIETLPQWVLVLDNADDLSLFRVRRTQCSAKSDTPNLSTYIPRGTVGTVLWTSRDQRIVGSLVSARRGIGVVRMTGAESEALFQAVSVLNITAGQEWNDLGRLLAEIEWLPLAITQTAAYIRRTKTSIAEYLQNIQHRKKRWKVLKKSEHDPQRRPEVSNSVLETWNISMEYIQQENKLAYDVLTVLAYVDNQNIPFEIIEAIRHMQTNENSDNNTICSVTSSSNDSDMEDEDDILEAVARLEEFSFLTLRAEENSRSIRSQRAYDMHKLVQEAVSYNLHLRKGKHSEEALSARTAFKVIDKLFPNDWSRKTWEECEKYLGHAQRTGEWAQSHDGEKDVAWLLSRVSDYLHDRGRWREKEPVDLLTLRFRKKVLGERHLDTIHTMACLGSTYQTQGKYDEAEKIYVEVLELRREILGEKHPDTIWSMADFVTNLYANGRYDEAIRISGEILELRLDELGNRHPDTISAMSYLATMYHQQGKYDEAVELRLDIATLRQDILGDKHPDTLRNMAYLAGTYDAQGKSAKAEKMRAEVLELRREILGEKHPDTIRSMADLAATYHTRGNYKAAEKMRVEVLELCREILGEKHPDTITGMADLATTYHIQGKYNEAETIYRKVLELRREILGEKHPDTVTSIAHLAMTYDIQEKYDEAEQIRVEVLKLRREILGEKHPDTITSMADVATTYHAQGKYNTAEKMRVEVLEIRRKTLGEKHPQTITSIERLAMTYYAQGKYKTAEKMRVEVLELRREILGEKHPDTIWSMEDLVETYHQQGRYQDAEKIEEDVLRLRREIFGLEHPNVIQSLANLAHTFCAQRRFREAEQIYMQVLQLRQDTLGEEHPDTVQSVSDLEVTRRAVESALDAEGESVSVAGLSLE